MSTPQDTSTGDTAVFASGLSIFASGMPMFTLAHDAPLSLDDASRCWIVRSGSLDLFLVPEGGGRQHPVLRINAGDAVLGTGSPHGWRMIALGSQGARVTELAAAQLYDSDVGRDAIARWLQAWNVKLKDKPFPKKVERVVAGKPLVLAAGESAVPMGDSTCVELETGEASFMGVVALAPPTALFVTASGWIEARSDCRFGARSAADLAAEGRLAAVLEATHAAYIACLRDNFAQAAVRERARLGVRARKDQARMQAATATLRSVVLGPAVRGPDTGDMLLAACRVVGVAAGIEFVEHAASKRGLPQADPLGNIATASRVRKRTVALKGEWWKTDSGPLLAFFGEIRSPVALIPVRGRGYNLHDPVSGKVLPVDAALAQTLQPFAYTFYRSFAAPALDLLALMRFASFGITREIMLVLALGLVGGILGLALPYLTAQLFDDIIPSADKSRLWQIVFALAAAGIAGSMFDITRSFTVLRMEGRVDSNIQAAVWDRLLRLPVPFFRKYTAGDLAMRAGAINAIRSALSGSVMSVIFSSLFSMLNLVLLFYYSSRLAWIAVLLVLVMFIFTITGSMFRLYFERRLAEGAGKQAGMVLQFLLGISKLRAAGAEGRAFGLWAANYAKQQRYVYNAQTVGTVLSSISAMYPLLASLVIFIAVTMFMTDLKAPLTTGEFLAFNAAFGAFLGAALGLGSTLLGLLSVVPMYERAETILKAQPEIAAGKGDPGLLTGAIELSHVSFSYDKDLPPVLDDVSFQIRPGEFVAFVGPSGSGKSTLLRLLLGFETPNAGSVFYDGQDLSSLDVGAVRRQTGVVLQNGQLLGGDIYSNIVGSAPLSLAEAADAAKACGLEDDINNMPMGMHTLIPDGGGSLSGGQRQRLLIARAIVTKPRILFLDEATSALDNRNQALVTDSLKAMRTTRVMIAHRLSTIIDADRIFVMHNGRLVQEGDFVSLMAQPGMFKDLATRQIA